MNSLKVSSQPIWKLENGATLFADVRVKLKMHWVYLHLRKRSESNHVRFWYRHNKSVVLCKMYMVIEISVLAELREQKWDEKGRESKEWFQIKSNLIFYRYRCPLVSILISELEVHALLTGGLVSKAHVHFTSNEKRLAKTDFFQ